MDKVRFGIIGIGNRGTEIAQRILNGETTELEITAVADTDPARLAWAAENLPGVQRFDSAQALLDSGAVDAVVVAVPHYDHPGLCLEALKRNIHVMCEKPAGVYTKAVRPVIEYAKICPATFAMMFNQRTNCVYRKMKEIVASGALGQIRRVNWLITSWFRSQSYYDSGSWRATWAGEGGGVLLNQCPHQLDLLQWLCGEPSLVRAFCHEGKWHDIEVEDDVTAYLEFPNGATGVFVTTTGDAPGTNRLEITGTKGKVVVENNKVTFFKLAVNEREWCKTCPEGFKKPDCEVVEVETDGRNAQHPEVLNKFAAHILRGEPLVADGREGINGLMISNAMHLSSWLDHEVTLPIDEKKFYELLMERCKHSRHKEESGKTFATEGSY